MKKAVFILAMLGLLLPLTLAQADNGAPNGAHYNLNIIAVPQAKTAPMDDSNGHTIFVPISGKIIIKLTEGEFQVLDHNAMDGNGASFQLPNPDPDGIIRVDLTSIFVGWPVPGTVYVSDVAAVGPGGSTPSALSNTFAFSAPCTYSASPSTWSSLSGIRHTPQAGPPLSASCRPCCRW